MFSNPIRLFNVFGFQVRLDPSWFLIAALIVWSLSAGYFPHAVTDLGPAGYLALSVVAMLGLFACLILHELSHSLVARRFGLGVGSITLFIFGGVAELDEEPASARSEFWIAIAGPVMSFALAGAFLLALAYSRQVGLPVSVLALFEYLAIVNIVLALFNLLPAFPLDGGRVLRAVLWARLGDVVRATRIASSAGVFFAYLLIGLGLLSVFAGGQLGGLWQVVIGLFLLTAARTTYQQLLTRMALKGKTVATIMTAEPWTVGPEETLSELVESTMLRHAVSFAPVVEDGMLLGYIDQHVLRRIDRENWPDTRVGDVFVAFDDDNMTTPDVSVEDLMRRILKTGRRKYLVVAGHRLAGIITLADILSYLSVSQELGTPQTTGSRHRFARNSPGHK